MSTIQTWTADYESGDANLPQPTDPIPYPVDGDFDVGAVLRDSKAVTRGESLNRLWEPDPRTVTYVSTTTFKETGDFRTTYPLGTAVKFALAGGTVYSWIVGVTFAAGETTWEIASAILTNPITSATFSGILPGSSFARESTTYPANVGGMFPWRITQRAEFQISDPATTVGVFFLHEEPDDGYLPLIQPISQDGTAPNGAFRITDITRTETGFFMTIDAAPAPAVSMLWEYLIVRIT